MTLASDDSDTAATLRAVEATVGRRRRAEVDDLQLCLHFADLNASDPRDDPGWTRWSEVGGDELVQLGGDGTPRVRDLPLCELAAARSVHVLSARAVLADALDLRHRLPLTWAHVVALRAEPWLARRVAASSRHLSGDVIGVVDAAVAAVITGQSPSRVDSVARAAIIEADPVTHAARVAAEEARRFATLGRTRETGLRDLIARLTAGDACWVDATLARVAEILRRHPDHPELHDAPLDVRRSAALGWLARPAELLVLLTESLDEDPDAGPDHESVTGPDPAWSPGDPGQEWAVTNVPTEPATDEDVDEPDPRAEDAHELDEPTWEEPEGTDPDADEQHLSRAIAVPEDVLARLDDPTLLALRPRTVLYVHLHQAALGAAGTRTLEDGTSAVFGVARVEGPTGPLAAGDLADLLGPAQVTVTPVVDLTEDLSTLAYEHPVAIRRRVHLAQPGDAFPHASRVSRAVDLDHVRAFDAAAAVEGIAQTSTVNTQPLSRTHHRAKTHHWTVTDLPHDGPGPPPRRWRSRHGVERLVDATGTHPPDQVGSPG